MDKYLVLPRELKNMKHEGDGDTNCRCCTCNIPKRLRKKTRGMENRKRNRDRPDYSIIENGQNTEKSHGDLSRLAITQAPRKDYQLMLMWKILKE